MSDLCVLSRSTESPVVLQPILMHTTSDLRFDRFTRDVHGPNASDDGVGSRRVDNTDFGLPRRPGSCLLRGGTETSSPITRGALRPPIERTDFGK